MQRECTRKRWKPMVNGGIPREIKLKKTGTPLPWYKLQYLFDFALDACAPTKQVLMMSSRNGLPFLVHAFVAQRDLSEVIGASLQYEQAAVLLRTSRLLRCEMPKNEQFWRVLWDGECESDRHAMMQMRDISHVGVLTEEERTREISEETQSAQSRPCSHPNPISTMQKLHLCAKLRAWNRSVRPRFLSLESVPLVLTSGPDDRTVTFSSCCNGLYSGCLTLRHDPLLRLAVRTSQWRPFSSPKEAARCRRGCDCCERASFRSTGPDQGSPLLLPLIESTGSLSKTRIAAPVRGGSALSSVAALCDEADGVLLLSFQDDMPISGQIVFPSLNLPSAIGSSPESTQFS